MSSSCTVSSTYLYFGMSQGLLVPKFVIQWHPALGSDHPYENTGEIVAFTSYLERGLGFPCSSFFSGLLRYYRIQLHHLTANSFVHIFHLRAFMRSFSGHQAPFRTLSLYFSFETTAQQIRLRCSRGHGSPT